MSRNVVITAGEWKGKGHSVKENPFAKKKERQRKRILVRSSEYFHIDLTGGVRV